MDQGYVVTCAPNARDLQMRQLPCQYAYKYDPVAGITLPLERHRRWYRTTTRTGLGRALLPRTRPRCRHYTAARTTRRWHRTATRIDKLRTDVPVELRPVDKTSRRYACEPEPVAGTVLLLQ